MNMNIFSTWLQEQIDADSHPSFKVFRGRQEDMPDRCTTVWKMGPTSEQFDGLFEVVTFRLQTRGASERLDDAEDLALFLDGLIDDQNNIMMGGVYVTDAHTLNAPMQLPMQDRQSRYQFIADYSVLASKYN